MRICLRGDRLNFSNRDDWQKAHEQQEHREEQSKRSYIRSYIDPCGRIKPPAGRKEIAVKSHDNDEALEPHSNVYEDGENPNDYHVSPEPANPKKLRDENVATDHPPVTPPVRSESTVNKSKSLVRIAAVPCNEKLHAVGVPDDCAGRESDLAH